MLVALIAFPSASVAQEGRVYVGGTVGFATRSHEDDAPLGGTTWGGSVLFGVEVSRRVALEFEPAFGGAYSWEYTYRPSPALTADVVASRRDTFFSGQARLQLGALEPVVGLSYVHGRISRRATLRNTNTLYFDDSGSDSRLAIVGGVDAPLRLAPHFYFVPTFRVFVAPVGNSSDAFSEQTSTGSFEFRYGAGVQVRF